jgi:hypothetical protein
MPASLAFVVWVMGFTSEFTIGASMFQCFNASDASFSEEWSLSAAWQLCFKACERGAKDAQRQQLQSRCEGHGNSWNEQLGSERFQSYAGAMHWIKHRGPV